MPVQNRTDVFMAFPSLRRSRPPMFDHDTAGKWPHIKNELRDLRAPLRTLCPHTGARR